MEGMSKIVLAAGSMASAILLACMAAVLTATPGVGKPRTVTLVGAGDIAGCNFKADRKTARLVGKIPGTIFTLGDHTYPDGTRQQFRNCYHPTWGKYKKRTRPAVGNHDYHTAGAKPYFNYFRWRAGRPRGYYSYDRGSWHIVALNSNCNKVGGCEKTSTQGKWLRNNLANTTNKQCTLAYFHHPLYSTGNNVTNPNVKPLWQILYNHHAEVIVNGHAHRYERYAPLTSGGKTDLQNGTRQIVAGTGGAPSGSEVQQAPGVRVVETGTSGVLKLELSAGFYSWMFVAVDGTPNGKVMDSTPTGTESCH
jgi:acid phosphatase type 7